MMQLTDEGLHLGIVTGNGDGMLDFYSNTLGLSLVGEVTFPGLGVVKKLQCGNSQIKLLVLEKSVADKNPGGGFAAATGYRYASLTIANIQAVVDRVRAAGCVVTVDVMDLRPGVKAAMVEDPDGNAIEFMQRDGDDH